MEKKSQVKIYKTLPTHTVLTGMKTTMKTSKVIMGAKRTVPKLSLLQFRYAANKLIIQFNGVLSTYQRFFIMQDEHT